MYRYTRLVLLALASAMLCASAYAADPSMHEVYQAAESGQLKQAESMMDQVLRDHPNSAKAHFVEAQLFAKEGRIDAARAELASAQRLAPGLPFAKAGAVQELTQRIEQPRHLRTAAPYAAARFPWGAVLIGMALLAALVFFMRTLRRPSTVPAAGGYPTAGAAYAPGGYPSGYGPGGMGTTAPGSGIGSGIVGGLATGAAVGAGMVAGEALMNRVLGGGGGSRPANSGVFETPLDDSVAPDPNYDLGGSDFGVGDSGSWDDSSFGGGGGDGW